MLMVRPFNLASKRGPIFFFFKLSPNVIEKSDLQDNKHIDPLFSNEIILIKLRNILIFDIKQDYNRVLLRIKICCLGREKTQPPSPER